MKKLLSIILALVLILPTLAALSACSGRDSDIPEGMKLVRGGEDVGYYLYGPEEWVIANQPEFGISCTYASKVNNTSVTMAESYFTAENVESFVLGDIASFPEEMNVNVTLELTEASLGNAEKAWKISYTYNYGEYEYRVLQMFAIFESNAYIMTYSASTATYDGEVSYYDEFLEKVQSMISNVKFVTRTAPEEAEVQYERDEDGFRLICDEKLAGFSMYIPDGYEPDISTSIVSASKEDGSNVNMTELTANNSDSISYWTSRHDALRDLGAEVRLINTEAENIADAQVAVELDGGASRATSLQYAFTLGQKTYHVYQVLIVKGTSCYVFTYTANEASFEDNFAEAQTILHKIRF